MSEQILIQDIAGSCRSLSMCDRSRQIASGRFPLALASAAVGAVPGREKLETKPSHGGGLVPQESTE